jgi:hypothetical protein
LASPYMDIESQDWVLAPSAFQPGDLGLEFVLGLRPPSLLLMMVALRLLLLLRLLLGKLAWWFSRLLRCWRQRPLVLLALQLAVGSIHRPKALLRQRLGGRNGARRIRTPKLGIRCAEAAVVGESILGVLRRVLKRGGRGFACNGAEGCPIVPRRRARGVTPGRSLGGMFCLVY